METTTAQRAPLIWPLDDLLLPQLQADSTLQEVKSHLCTPNLTDSASYLRVCPSLAIRVFCAASGPHPRRTLGAVYFSPAAAGAPGVVHVGALTAACDTFAADLPMQAEDYSRIFFTRALNMTLRQQVATGSVCRFDCWIESGDAPLDEAVIPDNIVVRFKLSDAEGCGHIYVDGLLEVASGGAAPPSFLQGQAYLQDLTVSQAWAAAPWSMTVPAFDDGWWPASARATVDRLVGNSSRFCLADASSDFPDLSSGRRAAYAERPGEGIWECLPGTDAFADVGSPGAAKAFVAAAVKVVRRVFWRRGPASALIPVPDLLGVYVFTANARGPPGRAHGGAVATALDDAMGLLCMRELSFSPALAVEELRVEFRRPTPLEQPVVIAARVVSRYGRPVTEAALFPADVRPDALQADWRNHASGPRLFAFAIATWHVDQGPGIALSYDEALSRNRSAAGADRKELRELLAARARL